MERISDPIGEIKGVQVIANTILRHKRSARAERDLDEKRGGKNLYPILDERKGNSSQWQQGSPGGGDRGKLI